MSTKLCKLCSETQLNAAFIDIYIVNHSLKHLMFQIVLLSGYYPGAGLLFYWFVKQM